MIEQVKEVLLRREHAGFALALIALFTINRIAEPYGTIVSLVLIYGGLSLIRKWFR